MSWSLPTKPSRDNDSTAMTNKVVNLLSHHHKKITVERESRPRRRKICSRAYILICLSFEPLEMRVRCKSGGLQTTLGGKVEGLSSSARVFTIRNWFATSDLVPWRQLGWPADPAATMLTSWSAASLDKRPLY